jgi:uncharacterized membrane protein YciS (DUF1049 family)
MRSIYINQVNLDHTIYKTGDNITITSCQLNNGRNCTELSYLYIVPIANNNTTTDFVGTVNYNIVDDTAPSFTVSFNTQWGTFQMQQYIGCLRSQKIVKTISNIFEVVPPRGVTVVTDQMLYEFGGTIAIAVVRTDGGYLNDADSIRMMIMSTTNNNNNDTSYTDNVVLGKGEFRVANQTNVTTTTLADYTLGTYEIVLFWFRQPFVTASNSITITAKTKNVTTIRTNQSIYNYGNPMMIIWNQTLHDYDNGLIRIIRYKEDVVAIDSSLESYEYQHFINTTTVGENCWSEKKK